MYFLQIDAIQAVILGIVQGLTEFMPISSSAHLIVLPWALHWQDPGLAFDVALHLGTLVAVLAFFWSDWKALLRSLLRAVSGRPTASTENRLLLWVLILGTIPGALAGGLLEKRINAAFHVESVGQIPLTSILLVAAATAILGLILYAADRLGRRNRELGHVSLLDGLIIGLAQAAALLPGVSRSGATITMGLLLGLSRPAAARFSFMLSMPIIAGAGAKEIFDVLKAGLAPGEGLVFLIGFVTAAVAGYLCIAGLLRFLQSRSTTVFAVYRLALGATLVALVVSRVGSF